MHEQFLFDEFDALIHVVLRVTVVLRKECRAESLEYLVVWRDQIEFLVSKCVLSLLRGSLLAGRGAAAVGRSHSQILLDLTYLFVSFGIQPLRSVSAPRPTCRVLVLHVTVTATSSCMWASPPELTHQQRFLLPCEHSFIVTTFTHPRFFAPRDICVSLLWAAQH